jgi:hypothetical protein
MDRGLIGRREETCFTREHVTVPAECEGEVSTTRSSYPRHPIGTEIRIPERTALARSGFAASAIPTRTNAVKLTEVEPGDLPQLTLARLKKRDPTEYQNLFEPNPYKSVQQVSYGRPNNGVEQIDRILSPGTVLRRGPTGYGSNERTVVGPPGDPRGFRSEKAVTAEEFRDPVEVRGVVPERIPNVVERSGFWSE